MATAELALPTGWEKRTDERTGKVYYVNHVQKKTQWDDPRVNDPQIWMKEARNDKLNTLKLQFPACPDKLLREGLIDCDFNAATVSQALIRAGYEQKHPVQQNTPIINTPIMNNTPGSRRPTADTAAAATRQSHARPTPMQRPPEEDMFALLYLKSRFPAVSDSIIKDVIKATPNDTTAAMAKLEAMGFEDESAQERRTETVRLEGINEQKRLLTEQRQKDQIRDDVVTRLTAEFPMLSGTRVKETLVAVDEDFDRARRELLLMEHARALAQEFDLAEDVVQQLLEGVGTDVLEARKRIQQYRYIQQAGNNNRSSTDQEGETTPAHAGRSGRERVHEAGDSDQTALARGADASLRSGSDSTLLCNRGTLAVGPNADYCRGPNKDLLAKRGQEISAGQS